MSPTTSEAPPVRPERTRRLFFALWPEPGLRESLAQCVSTLVPDGVGRVQRPDQFHLTLEFLGPVPESRLSSVQRAAQSTGGHACDVWLDRVAYWRRSSVLCLLASRTPPALADLVTNLRASLEQEGFEPERRPYLAHLTLARKVWRPVSLPAPAPVCWPVHAFALVESRTDPAGSVYSVLGSWPLSE